MTDQNGAMTPQDIAWFRAALSRYSPECPMLVTSDAYDVLKQTPELGDVLDRVLPAMPIPIDWDAVAQGRKDG